jgi:tetratricopeptide (TPR) repeat protein
MKLLLLFSSLLTWSVLADPQTLVRREYSGVMDNSTAGLLSMRGNLRPPMELLGEELNPQLYKDQRFQERLLRQIKYHLLSGELGMAKLYFSQYSHLTATLGPIKDRYLGLIYFIEGRYDQSLKHLSVPELMTMSHYPKICLLRTINLVALNRTQNLEQDWNRCKLEGGSHLREDGLRWMDIMVNLKLNPASGVTRVPFERFRVATLSNEELKLLLKLSLYLNQEKMLLTQLTELSIEQLEDVEVREIVGQIMFRTGSLAQAYRFIEDLKSPNAENIKGNLYILRDKYELAYAQFKLALEQKQNSQNALERLLPLAWLLKDWSWGSVYAERVMASPQTQINKMTLYAAFLTQMGKFDDAHRAVENIWSRSDRGSELDVTQISSFIGLMKNDDLLMKKNAELSCRQNDLTNCWLLYQRIQWGSYPMTVKRPDAPTIAPLWERLTQQEINEPLEEIIYVNPVDIEELDDKLIRLLPTT